MSHLLEVKNLSMFYHTSKGRVKAINDISFNMNYGETLGVVGESGCGKTSLGTSLLAMPPPPGRFENGSVILEGENILTMKDNYIRKNIRWAKVSMVFQGAMSSLTPVYTIKNQMIETLNQHITMDKVSAKNLISEYLSYVGLSHEVMNRYPHELSGGMKQRVVIATALFLKPKLVILDEPTTALDVIVQAQIINLLKKLKKDFNLSFIFITHDLALESEIADRIAVMYAGSIVEIGPNENIYGLGGPKHPYTKKLLKATPRINKKVENLEFIEGSPPDLIGDTVGCRFYDRCSEHLDICKTDYPPMKEISENHFCACHLV